MKLQSIKNQQGEVNFRKKLALQFSAKNVIYPGEPHYKQNIAIIKGRIKDYKRYFQTLASRGLDLKKYQPYLEIGAGIGQGSMFLENKFRIPGFATDISLETLTLGNHYQNILNCKKIPLRICCDAYNLPFKSGSFPFVFCFETLHHFPDPLPVLKEIKRVVAPGGYFYFNEEPVAQAINFNLWHRDRNLRWFEKALKILIVLHFISKIGKSEIEHNILEESFSLKAWEKALSIFDEVEATLKAFPFGPTSILYKHKKPGWLTPPFIKNVVLQIMGGGIEALCKKTAGASTPPSLINRAYAWGETNSSEQRGNANVFSDRDERLITLLACPNCKRDSSLQFDKKANTLYCPGCKTNYPSKGGIFILLPKKKMEKLYPEISQKSKVKIQNYK